MKKLLTTFLLLCFTSPAFAEIQPPKWDEFCPPKYVNAEYIKDNTLPPIVGFLCACSLVGIPVTVNDLNKKKSINTNNYWVSRREAFNKRMSKYKNITDPNELTYCYLMERQKQAQNDTNLRMSAIETQQYILSAQQNWQRINMQSQMNNIQTQNQFNKIQYNH
jgi:hypothetical protein